MYNEKLEALITAALADGVLTDKEKNILFKKAEAMGIDRDEFELVLNGRLAKRKKEMEAKSAQKKGAIPQELDDLIKEFLTDGIISVKERQVLLNKAQALGLNLDEVDLYIDAQQQKADQAVAAAVNKRRGKTCPFCGSSIPELTDKCPNCGGNITPEASHELEEILDQLEEALINFKSGDSDCIRRSKAEVERYVRKAKMYYGNNPKVQRILENVEEESAIADKELKKDARKKQIAKYKWVIAAAVIILIGLSAVFIHYNTAEYNAKKTRVLVEEAIKNGELEKAESLIAAYSSHKGQYESDLGNVRVAMSNAYLEAGDYDKAYGDIEVENIPYDSSCEIVQQYFNRTCKCIDYKKQKGESNSQIRNFINNKVMAFQDALCCEGEWEIGNVKKRLYEYAGLK